MGDRVKLNTPDGLLELPIVGMLNYFRSEKRDDLSRRGSL
jgi:hypothetical protein